MYQRGDLVIRDALGSCRRLDVVVPTTWSAMRRGLQGFPCPGPRSGMVFLSQRYPAEAPIDMWIAKVRCPLLLLWVRSDDSLVGSVVLQPDDPRTVSRTAAYCLETDPSALNGMQGSITARLRAA